MTAETTDRCATCKHWRSADGRTGSCGVMIRCVADFVCALYLPAKAVSS